MVGVFLGGGHWDWGEGVGVRMIEGVVGMVYMRGELFGGSSHKRM